MTVGYVDSSCLVAVALGEPGHEAILARIESLDQWFSANLLEAELRSALHREGVADDGRLLRGLTWVSPDRPLSQEIGLVLSTGYLRGADLWHLATALYLSPDPTELIFLTMDHGQATVAAAMGFPTQ